MDWNTRDVSGDSEVRLSFFSCSKFSVWDYNTSDRANIRDQLIENTTLVSVDVILSILNDFFRVQISDCYSMCLQFVCKQSDKNHSVHGCPFLAVIYWRFFQCVMKSTTAWLLKLSVSFIQARTQHLKWKQFSTMFYFQLKCITPCMCIFWH